MYLCVRGDRSCICVLGIDFASFYDYDFRIVPTVWYFFDFVSISSVLSI